jgi:hypothetical protein
MKVRGTVVARRGGDAVFVRPDDEGEHEVLAVLVHPLTKGQRVVVQLDRGRPPRVVEYAPSRNFVVRVVKAKPGGPR